jgi:hypothetical protein
MTTPYHVSLTTYCCRPAGKDFTVEIASNRAKTTLAYNGLYVTDWPDGAVHPDNYVSSSLFPSSVTPTQCSLCTCRMFLRVSPPPTVRKTILRGVLNLFSFSVHTQNESMAAGTAFAISYQVCGQFPLAMIMLTPCQSDITKVTPDNLVVFSVRYQYVSCFFITI